MNILKATETDESNRNNHSHNWHFEARSRSFTFPRGKRSTHVLHHYNQRLRNTHFSFDQCFDAQTHHPKKGYVGDIPLFMCSWLIVCHRSVPEWMSQNLCEKNTHLIFVIFVRRRFEKCTHYYVRPLFRGSILVLVNVCGKWLNGMEWRTSSY